MQIKKLNIALLLGFLVIVGIIVLQFFLLRQAVHYEEKKFAQKVHVALLEIANKLNIAGNTALPQTSPIDKITNSYFLVNVNSKFEVPSLSYYLTNEFEKFDITANYEYAYYDCIKEKIHYGGYIGNEKNIKPFAFTKANNGMTYYFAIYFTDLNNYLYKGLKIWVVFSVVMLVVMLLYGYSAFTLLQQKKYAALQKDFINNMTHEFKTPISSILIAANFLNKQIPISENEKLKKYSSLITEQTHKLNQHVEKILNLAKTESNEIVLNKKVISLKNTLLMVVNNIALKYPDAKININKISNCTILADEFHFANVAYNLIENAIKYCTITPVVILTSVEKNKAIALSFADNGVGVAKEELKKIFKKFYRVAHSKNNETNGFGLGLFYVKKICNEHCWSIQIVSEITVGTTVTILIPTHE